MRGRRLGWLGASCVALLCSVASAQAPAPAPAGWTEALRRSQAVIGQPLGEAAALPLADALNRPVTLAGFRGKPLVVSFVYTGCFQACPLATHSLKKAVEEARRTLGADGFRVLTIGFNQPFDTPEAMGAFARQARIADPSWTFASPRAQDVPALARAFGFSYVATPKGFDHITQATLVDAQGVVAAQVYGDDFDLRMFVGPLKSLLEGQAVQRLTLDDLWTKVRLYCTVYDPVTGRYRVNYSLFFELFCGATVLLALGWTMARQWRRR